MKQTCTICPYYCELDEGQTGRCRVRSNKGGEIVHDLYGQVYPVYKGPVEIHFNHFSPGSTMLMLGSLGCNLACKMCHNSHLSQSRDELADQLRLLLPSSVPFFVRENDCDGVLFTFNDPSIMPEYVADTARMCADMNQKTVICTSGYMTADTADFLLEYVDAVECSPKGMYPDVFEDITRAKSQHSNIAFDFMRRVVRADKWLEVTLTMVTDYNWGSEEIKRYCSWHLENLGEQVPLRFAKARPAHQLSGIQITDLSLLVEAYNIAKNVGLPYVYLGNTNTPSMQTTYCPECSHSIISRDSHRLLPSHGPVVDECTNCGHKVPGYFPNKCPEQKVDRKISASRSLPHVANAAA